MIHPQKGHLACKKLGVGLMVVAIWLELCTSYSSSRRHHPHYPELQWNPEWRHSGTGLLGFSWKWLLNECCPTESGQCMWCWQMMVILEQWHQHDSSIDRGSMAINLHLLLVGSCCSHEHVTRCWCVFTADVCSCRRSRTNCCFISIVRVCSVLLLLLSFPHPTASTFICVYAF